MIRATLVPFGLLLMSNLAAAQDVNVPFQKFVLDNGLQVVIHEDRSDPVVAVYLNYHVGSGREEVGRSGFAHLFEHLMFQGSAHVGDDQHFKIVSEAGGTLNGTTNRDRTNYFETLPSNQLETALWLEADRMGFLLETISQEKLDNQRDVVKNERRQNYENVPYAQAEGVIMSVLYPPDHGYNWTTIGSHEDLTAASLDDVKSFFRTWYGPNNCTLTIGGDVDTQQALALVKKWFGDIPRGPQHARPPARVAVLEARKDLVFEDRVQNPELTFVWPAPPRDTAEDGALMMLVAVLSANKSSVLDRALTIDQVLASRVSAGWSRGEQASEIEITVRALPGTTLDTLGAKVQELLAELDRTGVDPEALKRQQNRYESDFVNRFETVAQRTSALGESNMFTGDPANLTAMLKKVLATTPADVNAVLKKYIIGKPFLTMSVVPMGKRELALTSTVSAEASTAKAEPAKAERPRPAPAATPAETPAATAATTGKEPAIDRTNRPAAAPTPAFTSPAVWHDGWPNGVAVIGTKYTELPIVTLSLTVPGGHRRESPQTAGLSSLTASLMNEGTEALDTLAFADALDGLGASLNVGSDDEGITISLRTLKKHLPAAAALFRDVVLRPRLAQADFDRLKQQRLVALQSRGDSIRTIAGNAWARVMHGKDSMQGWPSQGTVESVTALSLDNVKDFYKKHVVPHGARLQVVGDLDTAAVRDLLSELADPWSGNEPAPLLASAPVAPKGVQLYLVDKPGAPQSEVRVGHPSVSSTDPEWYPLSVMNFPLGGAFSSRINMNLREDKGYTYGARSSFTGGLDGGTFEASAAVKTEVTKESLVELLKELNALKDGLKDEEVAFARDSLTQSATRQFESINALGGLLENIGRYNWPDDYPARRLKYLSTVSREQLDGLAQRHVHADTLNILVVGDAAKVREGLKSLGYPMTELDIDGNPLPEG